MIKEIDIQQEAMAEALIKLQRLAYQIEADLIKDDKIPYLTQGLSDLMRNANNERFLAYFDEEDRPIGVVSFTLQDGVLDIARFMVHPARFRQGIGSALLRHLEGLPGVTRIIAQAGSRNTPAIEFYKKNGIAYVTNIQVSRSVELATFEKML